MVFDLQGGSQGAPGATPGCSVVPVWLQAAPGSLLGPSNQPKIDQKLIKNEYKMLLKTMFSHGASLKSSSREPILLCIFMWFKILKIELSHTRELHSRFFRTRIGHIFCFINILKMTMLRAPQLRF